MVIAEKQNLQTDQRHRRILDRMNIVLLGPRVNRPRSDSILRSMDLFGLDPESFVGDLTSDQHVIESLFQDTLLQSYQDNRPQRSHRVPELDVLNGSSTNASQKFGSLSNSHRQQNHMKSEPDVHIIPITFINDKKQLDVKVKDVQAAIDISSQMDHDGIHTVSSSASDDDESCFPVEVIPDENSDICCLSTKSSMSRRSLPRRTQELKKKFVSKKDIESSISDVIVIDEPSVAKEPENQSIKNHRSNKDTLVGGANKVLADMGPDGFVTSENMDIPTGATYLTVKHGAVDISSPHATLSNSEEEKPVNEVPNYPVYSILKLKLLKECRQIDYIKGDGNCFFRALSKQLYGSERFHIVVRNLIVDLIATNKSKFSQFVDGGDVQDHVERMSQEQSWATTCEIYAAATLLQRDIFMLTPDHLNETYSWLLFKPVFKLDCQQSNIESHPCYITLCNTNGNHYDRIVGEHGGCNCFLPHPELEGVIYNVDLT